VTTLQPAHQQKTGKKRAFIFRAKSRRWGGKAHSVFSFAAREIADIQRNARSRGMSLENSVMASRRFDDVYTETADDGLAAPAERCTPCFTPGAMITTQRGELPIQMLEAGDRVVTRDNGIQPVRWVGKTQMFLQDFQAEPHLLPVLVRQGSLGKDLPERDMMVSPNHRLLVANERTSLRFSEREVLVAAKHLSVPGVHTVQSSGTTYIHFLCDRHEVVLVNGIWTESFQPEDHSLKTIGNAQRLEIYEIFPELKTTAGRAAYVAARQTVGAMEIAESTS
jgi:Hint domain